MSEPWPSQQLEHTLDAWEMDPDISRRHVQFLIARILLAILRLLEQKL